MCKHKYVDISVIGESKRHYMCIKCNHKYYGEPTE